MRRSAAGGKDTLLSVEHGMWYVLAPRLTPDAVTAWAFTAGPVAGVRARDHLVTFNASGCGHAAQMAPHPKWKRKW